MDNSYANDYSSIIADKLIHNFVNGDYVLARENFDETLMKMLSEDVLKLTWDKTVAMFGTYKGLSDSITSKKILEYDVFYRKIYFENITLNVEISVSKTHKVSGFRFIPINNDINSEEYIDADYVDKCKFKEVELIFADKILTGKLTLPFEAESRKVPIVILVHGSGPNDLDETIYKSKPFRDIAYGLSSKGIAVFRYNKRTFADKNIDLTTITIEKETVFDVVEAVKLVNNTYKDKFSSIYILGHSQGGYVMPKIAKLIPEANGFILLAANARSICELLLEQYQYIFSLPENNIDKETIDINKEFYKQIEISCKRILDKEYDINTSSTLLPLNIPASYWLALQDYNPVKDFEKETRDILFIQGGRDYQVTLEDFNLWKSNLSRPQNKFVLFDDLNHLMQIGKNKSTPQEYKTKNFVDIKVIEEIVNWVKSKQ